MLHMGLMNFLKHQPLWMLLLLYVLVWTTSSLVSNPNLDPYGDMLENFAWGQFFSWGELKHPPLLGWVTSFWFKVIPQGLAGYFLLAYLNAAVGLIGIYVLGRVYGLANLRTSAVLLLVLALPYCTLAGKFNANTILLSIWPWIAVCWKLSVRSSNKGSWLYAGLLGVIAALGVLAKYYTGVLLLSLALITVMSPLGREWLLSLKPWFAFLIFSIVLAPHGIWLQENDFVTLAYVQSQGTGSIDFLQLGKFALTPLGYGLLPLIALLIILPEKRLFNVIGAWLPRGVFDELFWLCALPLLISLLFGLTGFVSLSSPWAIPLGFGFTLLWLRNLVAHPGYEQMHEINQRVQNVFLGFLCLVMVLSPLYAWHQARTSHGNYYLPTEEAVYKAESLWFDRFNEDYQWVAGDFPKSAAVVFYGSVEAEILPAIPQRPRSDGMIFCHLGLIGDKPPTSFCAVQAERWSRSRRDQVLTMEFSIAKRGPRFIHEVPHLYRVYFFRVN